MAINEERYLLKALEFEGALRAYLMGCTRDESQVEELLQETYARVLGAGSAPGPEVLSVRTLALTIARTVALQWLRQNRTLPIELVTGADACDIPEVSHLSAGPDHEGEIHDGERELSDLVTAIKALPEECRRVVTLRKVYGYSQQQIAARLQIPQDAVERHLTTAVLRSVEVRIGGDADQPGGTVRFRAFGKQGDRAERA